jgi:hypothetical protein
MGRRKVRTMSLLVILALCQNPPGGASLADLPAARKRWQHKIRALLEE